VRLRTTTVDFRLVRYVHLVQQTSWVFGVGKFEQFDGRAPFSTMNATRAPSDGLFGGIRISWLASS
jgi:hypothetical protein